MNKRILIVAAVIVAAALGLWWATHTVPLSASPDATITRADDPASAPGLRAPSAPADQVRGQPSETASTRDRILARDRARHATRSKSIAHREADAPAAPSGDPAAAAPSSGIKDRIGGRDALIQRLNEDFIPLADECIAQAQQRDPDLIGMIAVGLDVVADEELGSVVDGVEVLDENELDDPALMECMRQTTLSLILPPPAESGREQLMITLNVEPAPT